MRFREDGTFEISSVREAQAISTSGFPELIRRGAFTWLRRGWEQFAVTYPNLFTTTTDFNEPEIVFYQSAGMQTIPIQEESMPAGALGLSTLELLTFRPVKRTGIIAITEEMVRFDRTTEIKNLATRFGVAQRRTMEVMAWDLMRTPPGVNTPDLKVPSVYQSASSATKPWVNADAQLFTGKALFNTILAMQSQKDPQGNLLGVTPETLVVPPVAQTAVKQVLESDWLGFTSQGENIGVDGPPTYNPYKGQISLDRIFTSPFFAPQAGNPAFTGASFPWLVLDQDSGLTWTFLEVEPLSVIQEQPEAAASMWFDMGVIRIRGRIWNCPALQHPQYVYYQGPVT